MEVPTKSLPHIEGKPDASAAFPSTANPNLIRVENSIFLVQSDDIRAG